MGGLLIGLAAAILLLFNGRIAGISGILGGVLTTNQQGNGWRWAFLLGMLITPTLFYLFDKPLTPIIDVSPLAVDHCRCTGGSRYTSGEWLYQWAWNLRI